MSPCMRHGRVGISRCRLGACDVGGGCSGRWLYARSTVECPQLDSLDYRARKDLSDAYRQNWNARGEPEDVLASLGLPLPPGLQQAPPSQQPRAAPVRTRAAAAAGPAEEPCKLCHNRRHR